MDDIKVVDFKKFYDVEICFLSLLEKLEGLFCQVVILGEGSGSYVSLKFGSKKIIDDVSKPYNKEQRKHKGEVSVFIRDSAWRLEQYDEVICGTYSPNDNHGKMVLSMRGLSGKKILKSQMYKPGYDLEIHFEDGYKLKVFTIVFTGDEYENYSVSSADAFVYVPTSGKIIRDR